MLTLARFAASMTPRNSRWTAGGIAMPSENNTRLLRPGSALQRADDREEAVGRGVALLVALHDLEVPNHLRLHLRQHARRQERCPRRGCAGPPRPAAPADGSSGRRRLLIRVGLLLRCSGLLKLADARPAIRLERLAQHAALRVNGAYGVSARSMPKMPM